MAFENEQIFEIVTPESENDSNYEEHEFLLCWYGRDGGYYQYMFTDRETVVSIDSDVINEKIQNDIRARVTSEERVVELFAEDLTKNQLTVIGGLLGAEKIIRLKKDDSFEYVGMLSNSYRYRESGGRYNLSFRVKLWNLK